MNGWIKVRNFPLILLIAFLLILILPFPALANYEEVVRGEVVSTGNIQEQYGTTMQAVSIKLLEGRYNGSIQEIPVDTRELGYDKLNVGDTLKIRVVENDEGTTYFQFLEYERFRRYMLLIIILFVLIIAFVGIKGIRTLIPLLSLCALLAIGLIPKVFVSSNIVLFALFTVVLISVITSWIRLKDKLLTSIISASVIVCLLIGFAVFLAFSDIAKVSYIQGTFHTLNDDTYQRLVDISNVSVLFIALGGTLNIAIQMAKFLKESYAGIRKVAIKDIATKGMKVGQKALSGELNNLMTVLIGFSMASLFLVEISDTSISFWDSGWVAKQVVLLFSSSLPLVLISPVTILVLALVINLRATDKNSKKQIKMRM